MLICLSDEFLSVDIFSNNIEVKSSLGMFINWYSYEFIFGLRVVINAKNNLGAECCLFDLSILLSVGSC